MAPNTLEISRITCMKILKEYLNFLIKKFLRVVFTKENSKIIKKLTFISKLRLKMSEWTEVCR